MTNLEWMDITSGETIESAIEKSFSQPVVIYKHSTRCGLSSVVKSRLERSWSMEPLPATCYFLNLIQYRQLSDNLSNQFQVIHESPQILIIVDGVCIFHDSHMGVNHSAIKQAISLQFQ